MTYTETPQHRARLAEALRRYNSRPDVIDGRKGSEQRHARKRLCTPLGQKVQVTEYRNQALEAFGTACQRCGSTRCIVVHHKDRIRENNALDNLEVLCRSCHNREHPRRPRGIGTHCPHGHEYTPENTETLRGKSGEVRHRCRQCRQATCHAYYMRKKQKLLDRR